MTGGEIHTEVERILAMSDEEILREAIAEGRDIELEVSEVTAAIELAAKRINRK